LNFNKHRKEIYHPSSKEWLKKYFEKMQNKKNYASNGVTPLENQVYNGVAYFLDTTQFSLHPNAITIIGLVFLILCYVPLALYDMGIIVVVTNGSPPAWTYIVLAVGILVYMVMDCMDGAQARRLKLSSPLGQFMDHGLDTVANLIQGYILAHCLTWSENYDSDSVLYTMRFVTLIHFYMAIVVEGLMNWDEHYSGVMTLSNDSTALGPVELQLILTYFLFHRGIVGPGSFSAKPLYYLSGFSSNESWKAFCFHFCAKHIVNGVVVIIVISQNIENILSAWKGVTGNIRGYNLKNRLIIFRDYILYIAMIASHSLFLYYLQNYNTELLSRLNVIICCYHGLLLSLVTARVIESTILKVHYHKCRHSNWDVYFLILLEIGYVAMAVTTGVRTNTSDTLLVYCNILYAVYFHISGFIDIIQKICRTHQIPSIFSRTKQ
jgi:phosphatidylglycerophosphate synthase